MEIKTNKTRISVNSKCSPPIIWSAGLCMCVVYVCLVLFFLPERKERVSESSICSSITQIFVFSESIFRFYFISNLFYLYFIWTKRKRERQQTVSGFWRKTDKNKLKSMLMITFVEVSGGCCGGALLILVTHEKQTACTCMRTFVNMRVCMCVTVLRQKIHHFQYYLILFVFFFRKYFQVWPLEYLNQFFSRCVHFGWLAWFCFITIFSQVKRINGMSTDLLLLYFFCFLEGILFFGANRPHHTKGHCF